MKFTHTPNNSEPPFEVFAMPVDHSDEITRDQLRLDRVCRELADEIEIFSCGVDINGNRHESLRDCKNQLLDEDFQPYCAIQDMANRRQQIQDLLWMPVRIEHSW